MYFTLRQIMFSILPTTGTQDLIEQMKSNNVVNTLSAEIDSLRREATVFKDKLKEIDTANKVISDLRFELQLKTQEADSANKRSLELIEAMAVRGIVHYESQSSRTFSSPKSEGITKINQNYSLNTSGSSIRMINDHST